MKTRANNRKRNQQAYALAVTVILGGVSIALYSGGAAWTSGNAVINDRNNTYNGAVSAAEGASEQVLSYLARDFFNQSFDPSNLAGYQALVPTNDWAGGYQFSDGAGGVNRTLVQSSSTMAVENLDSQFSGLYGLTYDLKVRSNAKPLGTPYNMTGAVEQDIQLASIPVFQFAIFYGMDLEINPGPAMKVTGKVHSNANLYTAPVTALEFCDDVTAVGRIYNNRAPDDPTVSSKVAPVYDAEKVEYVSSLSLPLGTNNSPLAVRQILEVPPLGENPASPTGSQRYYNQVDLIITTTAALTKVQAGNWDSFSPVSGDVAIGTNLYAAYSFVKTNASFWDARESKFTLTTDIDVGALTKWLTNSGAALNSLAKFRMGHQLNSIYVDDQRVATGKLTVVRVANGQQLPSDGLTVATRLPLYVQGHFNAPITTPGSTNTLATKPASLAGDAITVLSANWSDANSKKSMSQRPALDTTVNAAFLAGIVPTTNYFGTKHYSGGVENFPRFLEDWSSNNKTFTYNGSMVVMFPSQFATSFWIDPGTYYNAPTRKWAFDVNFLDYQRLPPATPQVRKLIRGQWSVVAAN